MDRFRSAVARFFKWLWVVTGHTLQTYFVDIDEQPLPPPKEERSFEGLIKMIVYNDYICEYERQLDDE